MHPNFLCIGAQKAGTTWLFTNLLQHPEIWMPHIKEVHYFDRLSEHNMGLLSRIRTPLWRSHFYLCLKNGFYHFPKHNIAWDIRFLFGNRNDQWYVSLFKPGFEKVTGDITPAYSILDKEVVAHISKIIPKAKIIFILRNPIDRAWSHLLMHVKRRLWPFEQGSGRLEDASLDNCIRHIENHASRRRGNYLRTLEIWQSYFPQEQFLIVFMEDIILRPRELLIDIYKFLEVNSSSAYMPGSVGKKVYAGNKNHIPDEVGAHLAQLYYKQIEQLSEKFSGHQARYIQDWLVMADSFLEKVKSRPAIKIAL